MNTRPDRGVEKECPPSQKMKPPKTQQDPRYEVAFVFVSLRKKRQLRTKQQTHKTRKLSYPPEDTLDLHFLFLSHVKGFIRGSVPVRIRVSMDRVGALFALVRAPAGLSEPDKRTMFCIVRLFSIS